MDGKQNRRVLPDQSSVAFVAGRLLFSRGNTLMAQTFDAAKGQTTGEAVPIPGDVSLSTSLTYAPFTVSETGVLLYQTRATAGGSQMTWYDRGGKLLGAVGAPGEVFEPAISPDEKSVAFRRGKDLWLRDLSRGADRRFTTDASFNVAPFWSPQGDRIVFISNRAGGAFHLYESAVGGTGQDEPLLANGNQQVPNQWSRDGRFVVYSESDPKTKWDLWAFSAAGSKPVLFLKTEFNELFGQLSPDSHWMAYTSDESGQREVYVRPFPSGDGQWRASINGGEQPRWRGDGKGLFFVGGDGKMMAMAVKAGAGNKPSLDLGRPQPLFDAHLVQIPTDAAFEYDVTADGKRFLVDTDTAAGASAPLTVVVNWNADLKR